jgi:hypothetical protein
MLDFEIVTPMRSVSLTFEVTPVEIEFALATEGQSLREQTMLALLAKLLEPDSAD